MNAPRESQIVGYINQYDFIMDGLLHAAQNGTSTLEDFRPHITAFYNETFTLLSLLSDLKSLPLEELHVKRLLLKEWHESLKDRQSLSDQCLRLLTEFATKSNDGRLPLPIANADHETTEAESFYRLGLNVQWHYQHFMAGLSNIIAFLSEATKPYQNKNSLDQLQKSHDKELNEMLKEYLTTEEAAKLLKTSTKTVLRKINSGQLIASRQGNSPYRIRRLDVELMLAGH
jgi:excisionase family DNA binding protein